MQQMWRMHLKEQLEKKYIHNRAQEWLDIYLSTTGNLDLTVVSNQFADVEYVQRKEQIQQILIQLDISFQTGMFNFYTPQEAETLGLFVPVAPTEQTAYSWIDLATLAANLDEQQIPVRRVPRQPRTIVFYSFKGGVGRTTALTHVAWSLAQRGRKVVVVDLDLEAPGLSSAFNLVEKPPYGIIDYFYERAYLPKDVKPQISIAEIFGEVRVPDASGRLFVVPAGNLTLEYIVKIADLRSAVVSMTGEDLWTTFFNDIKQQVQPDIILVDSRTGINEWGAFTLLRAADQAIVFLYPNEQNRQGISLLIDALAGQIPLQFVFSPVPAVVGGQQLVTDHWSLLQERLEKSISQNDLLPAGDDIGLAEPITIYYTPEIALATNYPVLNMAMYYMSIVNVIDEEATAVSLEKVFSDVQQRRKILVDLKFPESNAASVGEDLSTIFQRTSDFDKFLDNGTCLIRGRKGTGKTTLYRLFLKHKPEAQKLAHGRLDQIELYSGHGYLQNARPTKGEFREFSRKIKENNASWIDIWRAYLFLRLYQENRLQRMPDSKFQVLHTLIKKLPKDENLWKTEHTQTLIQIALSSELSSLVRDWIVFLNTQVNKQQQTLWLLYDDLDVDLERELREEALVGLFQLVQTLEAQNVYNIRLKIFLREDIWNRLIYDNKSHFRGRDISLQWTQTDFLRLALQQVLLSKEYKELVNRFVPIGADIDQADSQTIEKALQILWGTKRQPNEQSKYVVRWIYDRLTDASATSFPRSLTILLKEATAYELQHLQDNMNLRSDRLLQLQSLNAGLIEASFARCQELREEYTELGPFFDSLVGCEIIVSLDELHKLWEPIQQALPEFKDFNGFVKFLIDIGLIKIAEKREKKQGYRFAEIYTHGFRLSRGARKF